MMDGPDIVAPNYNALADAFRERQTRLGLSNRALDERSGLALGTTDKMLGPSRTKGMGAVTIECYMAGLCIDLVVRHNPQKFARFEAEPRAHANVRPAHRLAKVTLRHVMVELSRRSVERQRSNGGHARAGRKGGLARWAGVPAAERTKHARKLGKASARARKRRQRDGHRPQAGKARDASGGA
jgi:hypothetical protein